MEKRLAVSRRRATEPSVSALFAALAQQLPEDASLRTVEVTRSRVHLEVIAGDGKKVLEDFRAIAFLQQLKIEVPQRAGVVAISFQMARRKL
jgi:hypothetical protein